MFCTLNKIRQKKRFLGAFFCLALYFNHLIYVRRLNVFFCYCGSLNFYNHDLLFKPAQRIFGFLPC